MSVTPEEALKIIKENRNVAIVGLSPKEDRPSHTVGLFLKDKGFNITPVAPFHKEILGLPVLENLSYLKPGDVDWIDMFVNPKRLMEHVDEIIRLKPKLVWCQIGVVNEEFNQRLADAGIPYIANLCPKIELSAERPA